MRRFESSVRRLLCSSRSTPGVLGPPVSGGGAGGGSAASGPASPGGRERRVCASWVSRLLTASSSAISASSERATGSEVSRRIGPAPAVAGSGRSGSAAGGVGADSVEGGCGGPAGAAAVEAATWLGYGDDRESAEAGRRERPKSQPIQSPRTMPIKMPTSAEPRCILHRISSGCRNRSGDGFGPPAVRHLYSLQQGAARGWT